MADEHTGEREGWQIMTDDGFIALVGPIWYHADHSAGKGRFRFKAQEKHRNRRGVVQGGMLMTFADRAMGMTAREDDPERLLATVQLDVHFIAAVEIGDTAEIACQILKRTGSLIFVDATITVEGRIAASARGTWKILRKPA